MNTRKLYTGLLLSIIILTGLTSFRVIQPDNLIEKLKASLTKYNNILPGEKIYLHTDKPFYKPGDDIWFKAYLLESSGHRPSKISEVAYVELINPKGNIEKKLTLPVVNGYTHGDYRITEAMPGGIYKIRAYTNWMKNEGDSCWFEKDVQIQKVIFPRILLKLEFEKETYSAGDIVKSTLWLRNIEDAPLRNKKFTVQVSLNGVHYKELSSQTNSDGEAMISFKLPETLNSTDGLINILVDYEGNTESISRSIPIVLNNIDLQFFPEGADLIKSIATNVAFKAINEFGKPADIEGTIYDKNGMEISRFSSFHDGMGVFRLVPENGPYMAKITNPAGIDKSYPLPEIKRTGYVLNLDLNNENQMLFRIVAPKDETVNIVGQIRGNIVFSETIETNINGTFLPIDASKFPKGIMQVTLFDKYDIARCERLVFVNSRKGLNIKITPNKKEYKPRETVELSIETTDSDSIPVPANISLSVVNDKVISFSDDKQDNILSWFLMSSELKGTIHEPSFYFNPKEKKAQEALDLVLLTHGWRRFTWENVLNEKYNLIQYPEKVTSVSGIIKDSHTQLPVKAEVTLLELNENHRAAMVTTKADGKFYFQSVNPYTECKLMARADGYNSENLVIEVDKHFNQPGLKSTDNITAPFLPAIIKEQPVEIVPEEDEFVEGTEVDIVMTPDFNSLDEVVVTALGIKRSRKNLSYSMAEVEEDKVLDVQNIEQALQGRVAGVHVINNTDGIGESANVRIRGVGSIAASDGPLYVVDGVPQENLPDSKLSPIGFIAPNDVESVTILKDAAATALYGSQASNGVIVIETKKSDYYFRYRTKKPKVRFQVKDLSARKFSRVREFYSPVYKSDEEVEKRTDFRTTVYWNPSIKTNNDGKAVISFCNNDDISTFRITAEGAGPKGLLGRNENTYYTQLPFTIDAKIPSYFCFGDTVNIQAVLKNNSENKITGTLTLQIPENLRLLNEVPDQLEVKGNDVKTIVVSCIVKSIAGKGQIGIYYSGNGLKDAILQEIDVQPKGFPVEASTSSREIDKTIKINISDPLEGSITGKFTAYPDVTSNLLAGIESILREPYGCFEQTSSSTYPNIMVLQYLQEAGITDPALNKKALDLIIKGYKRLITFETKTNGYEWFGSSPGHESLTAYGIMEFVDMSKVYDGVDQTMIKRTTNWLMKRRDGKGNFKVNPKGLDSFGRASQDVTNAYIVYSLSEAGITNINTEYEHALNEALESKDPYRVGLMACSSFNLGKNDNGENLLDIIRENLSKNGFDNMEIEHSVTRSYGNSLYIETASIYLLALLKSDNKNYKELLEVSDFISNSRSYGGFGSTQATIMALKSLTGFAKYSKRTISGGIINVYINNALAGEKSYEVNHRGEIVFNHLEEHLIPGENTIRVQYNETDEAIPYTLDFSWTSLTPNSSNECVLNITTNLSQKKVKVGETVRLSVTLSNKTAQGQPMSMAIIGIPSGLGVQPWQLKEMQEKELFDFYEIHKNYLILYYRQMKPNETKLIDFDLKAEVPGNYTGPASTAYLYYTKELKDWEQGIPIEVIK